MSVVIILRQQPLLQKYNNQNNKLMAKKLKAFVRYDGTGKIISGALILAKKAPKVGKWVEIPAYECCNYTTTTTTTTELRGE